MKRIYRLRRTLLLLIVFICGALLSGNIPSWIKLGFPVALIWIFILYDEALFEYEARRNGYKKMTPPASKESFTNLF